ncbi:hypothetical protein KSW89_03190 [Prevotella copri]|uniref:Uncharacterized protein n=1 Tax=Segatella copri TaxID=165179 RepID=A0AAW4N498_9BACT|nr:hypothetical protein [Segatella copri]MBU9910171.1 hypothetical protein [Segatella copri]MBV3397811.1 hypothetical protein [Segatella copri]MBV3407461.1 hypothetical protein [Segatella copri]MBV3410420.1 hypothetical protein [Segatella copri]MBV3418853.1 hypothetical protein [Segatella copri]
MSGNKIIICPGAFYNEHVEQQNIFGVVNVYPPKDGERGGQTVSSVQLIDCSEDEDLEAEDVAAADISQKETGRGRKSECLFALDENYCVKDEAKTRKQADLFCRFLEQNELAGLPTSSSRNSPLNIAIFSFLEHWKENGVIPRKRAVGVNTIFRFLTKDCQISIDAIEKSFNNAFCNKPLEKDSDMEKLVDAFFEENM